MGCAPAAGRTEGESSAMSIETSEQPTGTGHGRGGAGPARARGLAVAAGLLAGLSVWFSCELSGLHRFTPPARLIGNIGPASSELTRLKAAAEDRAATFTYTLLGFSLGLALGAAAGLARRSPARMLWAALLGAAVGAGAGLGAAQAILPLFHRLLVQIADSVLVPMLLHGALWGAIGATCGLAYGWGLLGPRATVRTLLGGLMGALLGAIVFEVAGVLALTSSGTTQALPTTAVARLLALLTLALSATAGASWSAPGPSLATSAPRGDEPVFTPAAGE
jgi:hypothetical protein